jgi:hypothetical protein
MTASKVGKNRKPKTGGRTKGTPNKLTGAVKEMILQALDQAGGVDYLVKQAKKNPGAFLALVGKVLPLTLQGDPAKPLINDHTVTLAPDEAYRQMLNGGR